MKSTVLPLLVLILLSACLPAAQTPETSPTSEVLPTAALTPTPTPLKPLDLLDQATYDTLTSYGFKFGVYKDGKIPISQQPERGSPRIIGYLDKDGLHFGTTEFQAAEPA